MKRTLAANCSPQLLELLAARPDIVDAVKVSEFFDPAYVQVCQELSRTKPLILHGVAQHTKDARQPSPGSPGFADSLDGDLLRIALEVCRPAYISVHLEHHAETHLAPEVFLGRLVSDIALLRDMTGLPVHLENTHFNFPRPGRVENARYACDPAFIQEALQATGSGLLLDIAHAEAAAWHRGERALDYIRRLPLERVDEVHVNSPAMVGGELRDRHVEMTEESYGLLHAVLEESSVKIVSLEYSGFGHIFEGRDSKETLQRQLERLRGILLSVSGVSGAGPAALGQRS